MALLKNKIGKIILSDIKTHYKAIIILKSVLINQCKKTDYWQTDPHIYCHLIYDKDDYVVKWGCFGI